MPLYHLFPEPVYLSNLGRKLSKEEFEIITECKKKTYENEGNITSLDTYVLENKSLKNLKKDLNKKVIDYFSEVACTDNSIIPYITQSWINYTEVNQFHHPHNHLNSYVSGVFYINTDKEVDKIKFFKKRMTEFSLQSKKFNEFNATSWNCPVETGDVILFPSTLNHGVDKKKGTNTRISLGFNVFIKGKIGNKLSLTELIIK